MRRAAAMDYSVVYTVQCSGVLALKFGHAALWAPRHVMYGALHAAAVQGQRQMTKTTTGPTGREPESPVTYCMNHGVVGSGALLDTDQCPVSHSRIAIYLS